MKSLILIINCKHEIFVQKKKIIITRRVEKIKQYSHPTVKMILLLITKIIIIRFITYMCTIIYYRIIYYYEYEYT